MADAGLFDEPVAQPSGETRTWTVAELSAHLGRVLAGALPDDVWVEGQIRNLKRAPGGHVYFQLVEPTEAGRTPRAQLAVTLLDAERHHVNQQLKRAGGAVRMDDGIEVRLQGRVRWYGPRGVLQVRMHGIDPSFTLGRLQADRDRLLAALSTEGLLDANAARPFPLVPLRVGLVTSRGSAAHADVLAELGASGFGFVVRDVDARTQGLDCGPSVVRALALLAATDVDVVLVVRGGGARTDLAGFDTEVVARAIAAMAIPVLTGIGHEVDRSIADEVAHRAHKTPTAAAAALVRAVTAYLDRIDALAAGIRNSGARVAEIATERTDRRAVRVTKGATWVLARRAADVDQAVVTLARQGLRSATDADRRLGDRAAALIGRARRQLLRADRHLDALTAHVRGHDPARALARGWSITVTADGRLVRDLHDLVPGTILATRVAAGTITSSVSAVTPADLPPTIPLPEEPQP
ncbi:MAG: exodeoxyribonuclease VII large subunit [Acidimicrobiales bacterium]